MTDERILKPARTFLARWNGAWAEMWSLYPSHKTLVILIRRIGEPGNLYIACLGPERISGPVGWHNCQIDIEAVKNEHDKYSSYIVRDRQAGLEVVCGSIEVKENVKIS